MLVEVCKTGGLFARGRAKLPPSKCVRSCIAGYYGQIPPPDPRFVASTWPDDQRDYVGSRMGEVKPNGTITRERSFHIFDTLCQGDEILRIDHMMV